MNSDPERFGKEGQNPSYSLKHLIVAVEIHSISILDKIYFVCSYELNM